LSTTDTRANRPAQDAAEAARLFAALAARDDTTISRAGRSRFYPTEGHAPRAVVLLHGLTNCPQQWVPFAEMLHAGGAAVVIPRLPGHGAADRRGTSLARTPTRETLATVDEAIDIACGTSERVIVCGLSIGSALATFVSFRRADITRNVVLVPFFGLRGFPTPLDALVSAGLRVAPNAFVPWDPKGGGGQVPPYAYACFPTRALGRMLGVGNAVVRRARRTVPACETVVVLNAREPAIDNRLARAIAERFERGRSGAARAITWDDLPANHDIIDPTNALARTDLVYPRLLAEIERSS